MRGRERDELEAPPPRACELATRVRDEQRALADLAQPITVRSTWFCPPRQEVAVSMCSERMADG